MREYIKNESIHLFLNLIEASNSYSPLSTNLCSHGLTLAVSKKSKLSLIAYYLRVVLGLKFALA